MATYGNKDPNNVEMLLKRRKLSVPTLLDEGEEEPQDAVTELLQSADIDTPYKSSNSGDIQSADAYPSQLLSPVRVESAGSLYGAVPVVTGGQVLYPTALSHAREKARMQSDALELEREEKVRNLFGMQIAAPQMADALGKFYFEEINKRLQDTYKTLGREKATAVLGDITNPITQNILKPYSDYTHAVRASKDVQEAIKTVSDQIKSGDRVVSSATLQELRDIQDGSWINKPNADGSKRTIQDYAKIPYRFETYASLDSKLAKLKQEGFLEPDIREIYGQGITVDGKKINSINGTALINEIQQKAMSSPRVQALKQSLLSDPDISPDVTEEMIDSRLKGLINSETHKLIEISPRPSGGATDFDRKAAQYEADVYKRYIDITDNLLSGDSQALANVAKGKPYKDGVITDIKVKKKGDKVYFPDLKKTVAIPDDLAIIEYSTTDKYGKSHLFRDQVEGAKEIINVSNDWYNYKREGTQGYINREDITDKYDSDERFRRQPKSQQKTSQNSTSDQDPLGLFK